MGATPEEIWAVASDAHHLPRWWPSIERVEGVDGGRFTAISRSRRGRPVRIDFRTAVRESPGRASPARLVWEQELEGTPFERILASSVTELEFIQAPGGTLVSATRRQRLRGLSRLGAWLAGRGAAAQLNEALAGLAVIFDDS